MRVNLCCPNVRTSKHQSKTEGVDATNAKSSERDTDSVARLQRTAGNQAVARLFESENTSAVVSATNGGDHCAFKLAIKGITYCFVVKPDTSRPGKNYRLSAIAPNKKGEYGNTSTYYETFISVSEAKGQRTISGGPTVRLTGYKGSDAEEVYLDVPATDLANEWDDAMPIPKQDVDFAVLVVHDVKTKAKPWSLVFWMGDGSAPPPDQARVKTYDVDNSELDKIVPNQLTIRITTNKEPLESEQIAKLIASKTPRDSRTGFDPNTFVGFRVKTRPVPIENNDVASTVPFDIAAGQPIPKSDSTYISMGIMAPPIEIQANFTSKAWAIPSGLQGTSSEQLVAQFRLILLYLQDNAEVELVIYGDTDATGTDAINDPLSAKRAAEAKRFLTDPKEWPGSPGPLDAKRIRTEGRGAKLAKAELARAQPGTLAADDVRFRRFTIDYIVY